MIYNKNFIFFHLYPVPHPYPLGFHISSHDPASNLPVTTYLCRGAFPDLRSVLCQLVWQVALNQ